MTGKYHFVGYFSKSIIRLFMAKKKKFKETTIEDFYDLKLEQVDELVAALRDDSYQPQDDISMNISDCTGVSSPDNVTRRGKQKQFDPYKRDWLNRIPAWLKAIFIKWWFAGAVCWFIDIGLGAYLVDGLDTVVATGLALGLVTDVLVNPLFRFMEADKREYNAYMMFPFPFKAFWTFFANVIYYFLVMYCVSWCYTGLNALIHLASPTTNWYMEPLLFGVFCVIVDMAFIGIKDLIVYLVKKSAKKESALNA